MNCSMDINELREELIVLYNDTMTYKFDKETYVSEIKKLKKKYSGLLNDIAEICTASEPVPQEIISCIPEYVSSELRAIGSKRKKELAALDHKLNMVSFFMPLIGEAPADNAKEVTKQMADEWNRKMPGNKIGHSTYESINNGFRRGISCYISTAVYRSLDKPDDCYELTTLRNYRDSYLMSSEEGREIVKEYYNIAPTIVKRIDKKTDADDIYRGIWEQCLSPCIHLIEENKNEECRVLYSTMVRKLEKEYLYS